MIAAIDESHLRVGNRTWWGEFHSSDHEGAEYEWKQRQFIVRFESKWRVSIIWGYCTYSDNYKLPSHDRQQEFNETPERVEAGVLHADRDGLQPNGNPYGYLDAEQLNALLTMVSRLATESVIEWLAE